MTKTNVLRVPADAVRRSHTRTANATRIGICKRKLGFWQCSGYDGFLFQVSFGVEVQTRCAPLAISLTYLNRV
jgi:hypothetical protein